LKNKKYFNIQEHRL